MRLLRDRSKSHPFHLVFDHFTTHSPPSDPFEPLPPFLPHRARARFSRIARLLAPAPQMLAHCVPGCFFGSSVSALCRFAGRPTLAMCAAPTSASNARVSITPSSYTRFSGTRRSLISSQTRRASGPSHPQCTLSTASRASRHMASFLFLRFRFLII